MTRSGQKITIAVSLFAKEVQQLLPLVFALIVFQLFSTVDLLGFSSPDQNSWANLSILGHSGDGRGSAFNLIVVAVVAAYMLMPRELDQRTVEFLWALPIPRYWLIAGKWLTALIVLFAFLLLGRLHVAWIVSFDHNSITGSQISESGWFLELAMIYGVTAIALCYGMLIAFFRLPGIALALLLWIAISIVTTRDPTLAYLNPQSMLVVEHFGTQTILATNAWTFHALLATASLLFAIRLWAMHGDAYADWREHIWANPLIRGVTVTLGVIAVTAVLVLIGFVVNQTDSGEELSPLADNNVLDTGHYRLHFAAPDRELARGIAFQADTIYAQVREVLGAAQTGTIVADLTDTSREHLGIASWKKIRIRRSVLRDETMWPHVLAHETTHVFAATESKKRLYRQGASAGFFSEGIAEWVSYKALPLDTDATGLRLLAAAAWLRFDLRFEDLINRSAFNARYDENLIYALGDAWVSALARACGDSMPGNVLRAMGRDDAPQRLGGRRFWEDSLQSAGCDVERVNGELSLMMRALEADTIVIPRVLGGAVVTADKISFTLRVENEPDAEAAGGTIDKDASPAYELILRARDSAKVSNAAIIYREGIATSNTAATMSIPRQAFTGERFQFQFGVRFLAAERPFFERWQTGSLLLD